MFLIVEYYIDLTAYTVFYLESLCAIYVVHPIRILICMVSALIRCKNQLKPLPCRHTSKGICPIPTKVFQVQMYK